MAKPGLFVGLLLLCFNASFAQSDTLIGKITRAQLSNLTTWEQQFKPEYQNYKPDLVRIQKFEQTLQNAKRIVLFLGTWCSDSREQVPRILAILDHAKIKANKLKIIGVNNNKSLPSLAKSYALSKVPSLYIISKANDTLLLFEETPRLLTIEEDIEHALVSINKRKG